MFNLFSSNQLNELTTLMKSLVASSNSAGGNSSNHHNVRVENLSDGARLTFADGNTVDFTSNPNYVERETQLFNR